MACTAGYGVLHARSSNGLAAQISQGLKISQHDRATEHKASQHRARRHTAAGARHARHRAQSHRRAASTLPPPAGAAATPARVSGSAVLAVGDSVMLASAPQLQSALPGISIDAKVSRQVSTGLAIVQQLAASGDLRRVVVFALGTNGTFTAGEMHQLLTAIGPQRKLVLVNSYEARPWEAGNNRVIAAAARGHRNVVLANWFETIQHRTNLLYSDEVHPEPPGARLYAHVVKAAVRAAESPAVTGGSAAGWAGAPGSSGGA